MTKLVRALDISAVIMTLRMAAISWREKTQEAAVRKKLR